MNHWVMDYETLSNCFVAVFEHYKTSDRRVFVIHDKQNDLITFVDFLREHTENKEWHISYNGLAFDAQVTHFVIENHSQWLDLPGSDIAGLIYNYAAECIIKSNKKEFQQYPL